jgi:uncharacterized protein HemY
MIGIGEPLKENPILSYHLGMIYYRLGEKDKAKEYLKVAVDAKEAFIGKTEAQRALNELG